MGETESALIFLGTGCLECVPSIRCLIHPTEPPCSVCSQSLQIPPHFNPNYRCNTSLLIDYCQTNDEHSYILIDVGKTFTPSESKYCDGSRYTKFLGLIPFQSLDLRLCSQLNLEGDVGKRLSNQVTDLKLPNKSNEQHIITILLLEYYDDEYYDY